MKENMKTRTKTEGKKIKMSRENAKKKEIKGYELHFVSLLHLPCLEELHLHGSL